MNIIYSYKETKDNTINISIDIPIEDIVKDNYNIADVIYTIIDTLSEIREEYK